MNSSPSRQVWLNELIMTEIYTALLNMPNGKEELKRCLILNRYGSQTVCTVLHRDLTDANLQKMWGRGCGLSRFALYAHSIKATTVIVPYGSIKLKTIESSIESAIQKFSNLTTLHIREKNQPISTTVGSRIFELVVHLDQRDSQGQIGLDIRYTGPPIQFDVLFAHKGSSSPGLWLRSLYFTTPTNELLPGTNDALTLPFYRSLVKLDVPGVILCPQHLAELRDLPSLRELSCDHIAADIKEASAALKNVERLKYTSSTRRRIDRIVSNVTSLRHLELNRPNYQSIQTSMAEGWRSPRQSVNNNLVTLTLGVSHRDCRAISHAFLGLFLSKYFSRGTLVFFNIRGKSTEEQQQELLTWTRHVREFYAYMQREKLLAAPHKGWTQIPPNVNGNIDGQVEGEPTTKTENNPQDPLEQSK